MPRNVNGRVSDIAERSDKVKAFATCPGPYSIRVEHRGSWVELQRGSREELQRGSRVKIVLQELQGGFEGGATAGIKGGTTAGRGKQVDLELDLEPDLELELEPDLELAVGLPELRMGLGLHCEC